MTWLKSFYLELFAHLSSLLDDTDGSMQLSSMHYPTVGYPISCRAILTVSTE